MCLKSSQCFCALNGTACIAHNPNGIWREHHGHFLYRATAVPHLRRNLSRWWRRIRYIQAERDAALESIPRNLLQEDAARDLAEDIGPKTRGSRFSPDPYDNTPRKKPRSWKAHRDNQYH